jgi:hypothetical protein
MRIRTDIKYDFPAIIQFQIIKLIYQGNFKNVSNNPLTRENIAKSHPIHNGKRALKPILKRIGHAACYVMEINNALAAIGGFL